jgi:DUF438 domain-containing protein
MGKTRETINTQELARLFERISKGEDPKLLRKEATRLMNNVAPSDITLAEQNLIEHGYPAHLVQQLSAAFMLMGIIEEQGVNLKNRLEPNHVLRLVIAEHDLLRCFISDLEDTAKDIHEKNKLTDTCSEFRRLCHIIEHLDSMDEHIEREEDVIFPYLKKRGWASLCNAARDDHIYIRIAIRDMIELVSTFKPKNQKEFKVRLNSITKYLCPILREHITQEDNILYPIALQVIKDKKVWDNIKGVCDDIGYCGIHM